MCDVVISYLGTLLKRQLTHLDEVRRDVDGAWAHRSFAELRTRIRETPAQARALRYEFANAT